MGEFPDRVIECFAAVGTPARMVARLPLFTRYIWNGFLSPWPSSDYPRARYGKRYKWRLWLLFDIREVEMIETLINDGSDDSILAFHQSQLLAFQMVAIIGALIAQTALQALQLPRLQDVHYTARGMLMLSLVLSTLAVFFTCLQQRTYGFAQNPDAIRAWLSNGVRYTNAEGKLVMQSSFLSHQLLQAPFELLCMAITLFLGAFGVYLGSAYTRDLALSTGSVRRGNLGVLLAFIIGSVFGLSLFGHLLGGKDLEYTRIIQQVQLARDSEAHEGKEKDMDSEALEGKEKDMSPESANMFDNEQQNQAPQAPPVKMGPLGQRNVQRNPVDNMVKALQRAAAAHQECAEADREVAEWYRRLSG